MSTPTTSAHLAQLEGTGLIQLAALTPELEYVFRHVLVKEAAYASLVRDDRRRLHGQVAATLERLYLGRAAAPIELLTLLAHHYDEAGAAEPAARYYSQAGDAAVRVHANVEAAGHYRRALALLPDDAPAEQLISLHTRLGRAYEVTGQQPTALDTYQALEARGHARRDRSLTLAGLALRAILLALPSVVGSPPQALALAQAGLRLAGAHGDPAARARLLWAASLAESSLAHPAQAVEYAEQALALARPLGQRDLLASILNSLGGAYYSLGRPEVARAAIEEAQAIWRADGNLNLVADTILSLAGVSYFGGDYERGQALLAEGLALSRAIGDDWGQASGLMLLFFIHIETGDLDAAFREADESVRLGAAAGFSYPQVVVPACLGAVYSHLGQPDRGLALAQQALALAETTAPEQRQEVLTMLAEIQLERGEAAQAAALAQQAGQPKGDQLSFAPLALTTLASKLALHNNQPEQAESQARAAVEQFAHHTQQLWLSDLYVQWARALAALGRLDEASEVLLRGQAIADAHHSRRLQWQVLAERASVAERRGQAAEAAALRAAAWERVAYIAAHVPEAGLRESFLSRPEVRALRAAPGTAV